MKKQSFQHGEIRDQDDNILQIGSYGKKTPLTNATNTGILDYIMNNFEVLYSQSSNGNGGTGSGGGSGTNITVDSALSSTSTNPVQNKVLYAALNNKLDKNGTATYAARDSSGNIISSTYAKKTDLSSYVKSINNVKPDSAGNVNISSSGGGSNITVDDTLSSTSTNAIANKAVYAALDNKLDKTGTAAAATKATQDSYGNVIVNTYARKSDLSGYVKTINNMEPDTNGNINISTGGGGTGTSITVDTTLSSTSNNPIANKAVYTAVNNKLDKTGIAAYAYRDSTGNIITDTYAKKSEVSGVVKSVNNIAPDSNGNVTITVSGGTGTNITVDSALSSTSTNPVQNRVVQQEFTSVRAAIPSKVSQLTNDSGYLTQHQSLDGYVKTSGQNTWRAQQTFNLATLDYEQYTTPNSSTSSISPSTSAASYYATGAFTLNLATLSALLGSKQSTVFTAYITAGGDYALSITNGGTIKYIGEATDVAITSAGLLLNILMTKDSNGSLTSIVQANKLA